MFSKLAGLIRLNRFIKIFETINHKILNEKLHVYGSSKNALNLMFSYITDQNKRITCSISFWLTLLSHKILFFVIFHNELMMMNCFCGTVDQRKAFSFISSRGHYQRSSPSWNSDTPRSGFESVQYLSSGLVNWSCAVVVTITPRRHLMKHLWLYRWSKSLDVG